MKSRLAASTRSTSVWVFCCPTASPVGSVIVNITVAVAAIIASNIAAMLGLFGRLIESSWESMLVAPSYRSVGKRHMIRVMRLIGDPSADQARWHDSGRLLRCPRGREATQGDDRQL